jgi:hypothetical protein
MGDAVESIIAGTEALRFGLLEQKVARCENGEDDGPCVGGDGGRDKKPQNASLRGGVSAMKEGEVKAF